jgi:hypothetical protein
MTCRSRLQGYQLLVKRTAVTALTLPVSDINSRLVLGGLSMYRDWKGLSWRTRRSSATNLLRFVWGVLPRSFPGVLTGLLDTGEP